MKEKNYNPELAEIVRDHFDSNDLKYRFNEEQGYFQLGLEIPGKLKHIDCIADIKEDAILFYGVCPLNADCTNEQMMQTMSAYLHRCNYNLIHGNFEFDDEDGEIRFKVCVDCSQFTPDTDTVERCMLCIAAMYCRYSPGILEIVLNEGNLEAAEMKNLSEFARMLLKSESASDEEHIYS